MSCISLYIIENFLIWLVIIVALVAILKLFLPWLLAQLGIDGSIIIRVMNIVVWAIVVIFCIIVVFDLVACLVGSPGMTRLR